MKTVGEWQQPAVGVVATARAEGPGKVGRREAAGACWPCPLPFLPGVTGEALWGEETHGFGHAFAETV